jgi:pilus assembly protein Flp/PilA
MKAIFIRIGNSKVWTNRRGQDLVDYALLAGFLAVTAGALSPVVANSFGLIFDRIVSVVVSASTQGSAM